MKKMFALLLTVVTIQLLGRPQITWVSPPVTLSSLGVNASDPRLVVDSNGNTNAIWVENNLIKASTLPFNGSWSAATQLSSGLNTSSSPRIGVDSSGNVTAVWIESNIVRTASLPFNGSWGASSIVSGSGASSPALAVDASGNAVILWIGNGFVQTSTKLFGGLLSLVSTISANGSETSPQVAIGANGQVVAVWNSQPSGNNGIYFATKQINGLWSASATIIQVSTALNHRYPHVIVDASGNATVTWFRYNVSGSLYRNVQVLAASLPSGASSWTTFAILSAPGQYNPANLRSVIKLDASGNVIAFWTNSYDGTTFAAESAVLSFGGTWTTGGALQFSNLYGFNADVAVTPSGDATAVFMNYDGMNVNISAAESDIAGTTLNFWSDQADISTGTNNGYPKVAANASSNTTFAAAAWLHNNGSNNLVTVTTGSANAIAPPTSLSVNQSSTSLGVYTDYYNTFSWTLSADPNIVQYLLYRNGVYFKTINPDVTQFVDHNAVQNGTVTYGIAAVNDEFAVSPVATVTLF